MWMEYDFTQEMKINESDFIIIYRFAEKIAKNTQMIFP